MDNKEGAGSGRYVPGGSVLVARAIRHGELWRWNSEHIRLWIYLLVTVNASTKPIVFSSVSVGYGQVLKSYRRIAEECEYEDNNRVVRWHPSRIERMLKRFERAEMVTLLGTGLGTLITVRNFKMYQDFGTYRRELGTDLGTATGQQQDNNKQSNQSNLDNPPSENVETDAGKAVLNFVERVGCSWSLKASVDEWAAGLSQQYPRVQIVDEIGRAGDWHEERHARGKRPKSPTAALHNWLKRAQGDAEKNVATSGAGETVPFGSGAARAYR